MIELRFSLFIIILFVAIFSSLITAYPVKHPRDLHPQQEWDYLQTHIEHVIRTLSEPLPSHLPESPDVPKEPTEQQSFEFDIDFEEATKVTSSPIPNLENIEQNILESISPDILESPFVSEENEVETSTTVLGSESNVTSSLTSFPETHVPTPSSVPSISLSPQPTPVLTTDVELQPSPESSASLPNLCPQKLRKCLSRWRCDINVQVRGRRKITYRRNRIYRKFCRFWCRTKIGIC